MLQEEDLSNATLICDLDGKIINIHSKGDGSIDLPYGIVLKHKQMKTLILLNEEFCSWMWSLKCLNQDIHKLSINLGKLKITSLRVPLRDRYVWLTIEPEYPMDLRNVQELTLTEMGNFVDLSKQFINWSVK